MTEITINHGNPQPQDEQRMTSLEIAELTGKLHKDVMKAIRNMEPAWEKTTGRNFALSDYKDSTGRTLPCYSLTKTETLYVATKFNDEARARLVLRWEELERERIGRPAPGTALLTLRDDEVLLAAEHIVGQQLKDGNRWADGCVTTTDIARALGMETRDLNAFLVDRGIQRWQRGQYRLTADYEGRGLAQDRLFVYYSRDGKQKHRTYLVWTPKGAEMIWKELGVRS